MVVLSSEAQEIIRVCDRALVLYHGAIQGEVSGADMNEQTIMHLATGGCHPQAMRSKNGYGKERTGKGSSGDGLVATWKRNPLFSTGTALW